MAVSKAPKRRRHQVGGGLRNLGRQDRSKWVERVKRRWAEAHNAEYPHAPRYALFRAATRALMPWLASGRRVTLPDCIFEGLPF
jgi:hypothetical protein